MGNQPTKVNVLGFGFDIGPDGGGVTIAGLRVGGGKDGAEFGTSFGLGAQVDGKGAYAGAGTKLTVGGDGVKASAGASATGGDQQAGAGAKAGFDWKGKAYAEAVSNTSSEVHSKKSTLDEAKKDLEKFKGDLSEADESKRAAERRVMDAKSDKQKCENDLANLKLTRRDLGIKKNTFLNLKTERNTAVDDAKRHRDRAEARLEKASKDNKYGEKLREQGEVELQSKKIVEFEAEIKDIDEKLLHIDAELKASEEKLFNVQALVEEASKHLDTEEEDLRKCEAKYAKTKEKFKMAQQYVVEKQVDYTDAVAAYNKALEEQHLYQTSY